MAKLNNPFDARTVNPSQVLDPLPEGFYVAYIDESEIKNAKNGNGCYLSLRFRVCIQLPGPGEPDPQEPYFYANRLFWDNIILENRSERAVEIGRTRLSALCHVAGVLEIEDSEQLHDKTIVVDLEVEEREERKPRNRVYSYLTDQEYQHQIGRGHIQYRQEPVPQTALFESQYRATPGPAPQVQYQTQPAFEPPRPPAASVQNHQGPAPVVTPAGTHQVLDPFVRRPAVQR